jgi:DNA-binding PadR family transcriptional regulator
VYPTLSQLEDEGLIRGVEQEGTKLFEITDEGRDRLAESKVDPAPWEEEDDPGAHGLSEIGPQMFQIAKAAWQVAQEGNERQVQKAAETLAEARRALYGILAEDIDEPEADEPDEPETNV